MQFDGRFTLIAKNCGYLLSEHKDKASRELGRRHLLDTNVDYKNVACGQSPPDTSYYLRFDRSKMVKTLNEVHYDEKY